MSGEPGPALAGRRVLVTGGSSGIGACIARELARAGCVVAVCARRTDLLESVAADLRRHSPRSTALTVDLAHLAGLEAFAARATEALGGIDVLVNNAGQMGGTRLPDVDADDLERLMRVNYLSPVRLTLAVLPQMLERGDGQIVNVSSVAARLSPPTESAYAASKAALTAFFESAAADLWGTGVTVHNVYPGWIRTTDDPPDALHQDLTGETPETVAAAVRRQLEDGTFEIYVPEEFKTFFSQRARDVGAFVAASGAYANERLGPLP